MAYLNTASHINTPTHNHHHTQHAFIDDMTVHRHINIARTVSQFGYNTATLALNQL